MKRTKIPNYLKIASVVLGVGSASGMIATCIPIVQGGAGYFQNKTTLITLAIFCGFAIAHAVGIWLATALYRGKITLFSTTKFFLLLQLITFQWHGFAFEFYGLSIGLEFASRGGPFLSAGWFASALQLTLPAEDWSVRFNFVAGLLLLMIKNYELNLEEENSK